MFSLFPIQTQPPIMSKLTKENNCFVTFSSILFVSRTMEWNVMEIGKVKHGLYYLAAETNDSAMVPQINYDYSNLNILLVLQNLVQAKPSSFTLMNLPSRAIKD